MTIREALEKAERAELWDGTGFRRDLMALNYDMKLVITDAGREVLTALRKAEALDALQARMSGGDYGEVQRIVGGVRIHDGDEFALAAATLYELGRKLAEDAKQDCATRLNPAGTMARMVPAWGCDCSSGATPPLPRWEKWDEVDRMNRGCAHRITRCLAAQEKPAAPKEPIPEVYLSGGAPPEAAEDALRNCTVTTTDVSPVYAGISGVVLSRDSRPVDPAKESDQ